MSLGPMLGYLLAIDLLITVGDTLAKKSVDGGDLPLKLAALAIWTVGCLLWFPLMKARGFTRLIALADVIGLLMLAISGRLFLGERLTTRELVGVLLAGAASLLLGGR